MFDFSGLQRFRMVSALFGDKIEEKMRVRAKNKKPTPFPCNAGSRRFSKSGLIWTLVGCLCIYYLLNNIHHNHKETVELKFHRIHPGYHEFEVVEEEKIIKPPPRKRSPRAIRRKPDKRVPAIVNEFLDEDSPLRSTFFPSRKNAIDPMKDTGKNESLHYFPGKVWLDTDGNAIQAHGGGILYDERSAMYYWYGEYKDGQTYHAHKKGAARVDIIGVGCYSSKDLWTWKNEGIVLAGEEHDETHDLYKSNVLERPKVIYNSRTSKYVMWMHVDDVNYTKAAVGIATSSSPSGPFRYIGSKRPHGCDSRDMTIFKDDDMAAYLVYSSENNSVLHIAPLTDDYLDVTGVMRRVFVGKKREAPALFKYGGTYYMVTSGCTGWAPNEAMAHAAESVLGPWETLGNPCVGGNSVLRKATFFSQSSFVVPVQGRSGLFIFMADRWNPSDLRDSRYVWLPMVVGGPADQPFEHSFGFPLWPRVSIYWHRKWRLPG